MPDVHFVSMSSNQLYDMPLDISFDILFCYVTEMENILDIYIVYAMSLNKIVEFSSYQKEDILKKAEALLSRK